MGRHDPEGIRVLIGMSSLLILGLVSLGFGLIIAYLAGELAKRGKGSPGLRRKLAHVGIFSGAVPAHLLQGFWGVVTYGTVISVVVLLALRQGPGHSFYDALARPSDGDDSRRFVFGPLVFTAMGGLLASLLVGDFAVVGYLVCGWGDAAGEVVGEKWGRHRYSSPLSGDRGRTRSLEGSLGVLGAGFLGAGAAMGLLGYSLPQALGIGLLCGGAGALAEGLSGHGTDNLWVQLLPSLLAWRFLR